MSNKSESAVRGSDERERSLTRALRARLLFWRIAASVLLLAVIALGALVCLCRKLAENIMIVMGVLLLAGVTVCFVAAFAGGNADTVSIEPAFSSENAPLVGIFTIFALAPWAFAGFASTQ